MQDNRDIPTVAILGPLGTYCHQMKAAYEKFGDSVRYREERTITDVFNTLSDETPLAVIPQENSIFGSVVETYDLLRLPEVGDKVFVKGTVTISVQHCLLVRNGVKLGQIGRILSHEQALGQCSVFIKKNFPHATLEKTASTAAAAEAVSMGGDNQTSSAAICSKMCSTVFEGLEVVREGIQNENSNMTRFYILATACFLVPFPRYGDPKCALVRTEWQPTDAESAGNVARLLVTLGLLCTRVDRRPSLTRPPFHDVYFVEIQDNGGGDSQDWESQVEGALRRVKCINVNITLLGIW